MIVCRLWPNCSITLHFGFFLSVSLKREGAPAAAVRAEWVAWCRIAGWYRVGECRRPCSAPSAGGEAGGVRSPTLARALGVLAEITRGVVFKLPNPEAVGGEEKGAKKNGGRSAGPVRQAPRAGGRAGMSGLLRAGD